MVLTPLLVVLLLNAKGGGFSTRAVESIALQLLLPFLVGQLLRRWVGPFLQRHKAPISLVDRGSILLVVYAAFSEGMIGLGSWRQPWLGQETTALPALVLANAWHWVGFPALVYLAGMGPQRDADGGEAEIGAAALVADRKAIAADAKLLAVQPGKPDRTSADDDDPAILAVMPISV